ncbi:succinylglutamate desuccinylase [Humitalea rosea]|uniref:Succinylglutamate desuccinylase n=1 Tax=Humitalea rosea TaxID=990373 RepID=A0A2W7IDG9_9PROT|nr:succinylglutamate desuccinylase/aspartoacylase family protein [Humitalea rosea]PZW43652.1 succinylglutamate desuccinylase [Humitalea rosea]
MSGGVPDLTVRVPIPDLRAWLAGSELPGVTSFQAQAPGPHVALCALMHGNEIAGAIVLDRLLRQGLRPRRGRLSFIFGNILAYGRFDPMDPTASRFVEEDLNRVWDLETLEGPRRSAELRRARELRPFLDTVDLLLDLHSMLWPSEPLILAGATAKGRELARAIGVPPLVVTDSGHAAGKRLLDYGRFGRAEDPAAAVLVEGGPHWAAETIATLTAATARFLRLSGVVEEALLPPDPVLTLPRFASVTRTITAASDSFAFLGPVRGGDVVPRRNTLIALDGEEEIRTPHDDCLLVMPSPRVTAGQTAVRLARLEPPQAVQGTA